jgi:hypothetical protein
MIGALDGQMAKGKDLGATNKSSTRVRNKSIKRTGNRPYISSRGSLKRSDRKIGESGVLAR